MNNNKNEMENTKRVINFKRLSVMVRSNELKSVEKLLILDLLLYAGVSGDAFPSQQTLAKDLGCSARYIRDCLKKLKEQGLLIWKRRGFGKPNLYTINEEFYYHNDKNDRNSPSAQSGNIVPHDFGTQPPPNVIQLNNSSNVIKKYSSMEDITDGDIQEIAFQYKVPEGLVKLQFEALRNYCASKGRRYKNYKAALRNFVLREAKSQVERNGVHDNKRGIDARHIK